MRPVVGRARRQGRHFVDEPVHSPHRLDAQKKTLIACEQDRPDVKRHRIRWRKYQKLIDPSWLVFIDETWTKTNMTRLYGWAPRGRRLVDKVSWTLENLDVLAALRCDRVEAPCLFDGPINGERFLAYVTKFLIRPSSQTISSWPTISARTKARPCATRSDPPAPPPLLPKYSPDLNLIEQVFAKLKTLVRKAEPRTFDGFRTPSKTPSPKSHQANAQTTLRHAGYADT